MTYDDIRNMAFEAGLEVHKGVGVLLVRHSDGRWVDAKDELMAFANIAFAKGAAAEREACAVICENYCDYFNSDTNYHSTLIRARGQG